MGVGKDVYKEKKALSEIAGNNGKVLLYPEFGDLSEQLGDILEASCGKLSLLNFCVSTNVFKIDASKVFQVKIIWLKDRGPIKIRKKRSSKNL